MGLKLLPGESHKSATKCVLIEPGIHYRKSKYSTTLRKTAYSQSEAIKVSARGFEVTFGLRRYGGYDAALAFARDWKRRVEEALPQSRYFKRKPDKRSASAYPRVGIYHEFYGTKGIGSFYVLVFDKVTRKQKLQRVSHGPKTRSYADAEIMANRLRDEHEAAVVKQQKRYSELVREITEELARNRPKFLFRKGVDVGPSDLFLVDVVAVPKVRSPWDDDGIEPTDSPAGAEPEVSPPQEPDSQE